jgi:hypothetical protein
MFSLSRTLIVSALAVASIIAPAKAAEWLPDMPSNLIAPAPATLSIADLSVQTSADADMVLVADILRAPIRSGNVAGVGLLLPEQMSTLKLERISRMLKIYDLDKNGMMSKAELTQALLGWAISSRSGLPYGVYSFSANGAPATNFVLDFDSATHLRKTIVQHGRPGSTEVLGILAAAR